MIRETITLTQKEQRRVHILTQVQHGAVQAHEAARLLGLSYATCDDSLRVCVSRASRP